MAISQKNRFCQTRVLVESKYKFKDCSHHAVDPLTRLTVLLFLRNIYVSKCTIRAYRNRRNNIRANVLYEGKPLILTEREFVRNEIFANSVRPMGFSRLSMSSYSADDGKLYSAICNETSITLRFDFPDFVTVDKKLHTNVVEFQM